MATGNLFVVQVLPQKHTQVTELRTVNQTDGLRTCMRILPESNLSTYLIIGRYETNEVVEECFWRKGRQLWLSICPNNGCRHLGLIIPFIFFTRLVIELSVNPLEVTLKIPSRSGRSIDVVINLVRNLLISVLFSNFSISENHPYEILLLTHTPCQYTSLFHPHEERQQRNAQYPKPFPWMSSGIRCVSSRCRKLIALDRLVSAGILRQNRRSDEPRSEMSH